VTDDFEPNQSAADPVGDDATPVEPKPVRARRSSAAKAFIAVVIVVVVVALAGAGVWANARWGAHAMVTTGALAARALIEGRPDHFASVSSASLRSEITTATAAKMAASAILVDFSSPEWSGDQATLTGTTGMGVGELVVTPVEDGSNVVRFRTDGVLGLAKGALSMVRTWSGWAVSGLVVEPITKPANHPSATPTSTVTTTTP
jgi:hypothetical protein